MRDVDKLDRKIRNSRSIPELFELVKKTVWNSLGKEQAGILIGLAELGTTPDAAIGAFYSPEANTIVMNTAPMTNLSRKNPELLNYYSFYMLLHEYVHAIGVYEESEARALIAGLSRDALGENHIVTDMATGKLSLAEAHGPEEVFRDIAGAEIEYVLGIDRESTNYIR